METPDLKERLVCAFSYLSAGWVGLIYFIILYFMKKTTTRFLRYNVFQSIFLALALFLISVVCKFVFSLILWIPFINTLLSGILLLLNKPFIFNYSIIQFLMCIFFLYLAGMSFMGRYPKVYWISDNIIVKASR